MNRDTWRDIDQWFGGKLVAADPGAHAQRLSREAGMPEIAVSTLHAKMLALLVAATGARRVLEVGTLGGYSACWMASAMPEGGRITSLEIDPAHADVARRALKLAAYADKVEIVIGAALDLLPKLSGPFDFAFIDADKENNPGYFDWAVRLSRPGALIVVDNVVRDGKVIDPDGGSQIAGVRRMVEAIQSDTRVDATAVQTVGDKGYDGFLLARLR